MKKLMVWTKVMGIIRRYKTIDRYFFAFLALIFMTTALLTGCGKDAKENADSDESGIDIRELQESNSDIFAWIHVPDSEINYPVLQSSDGDDSFYQSHNSEKEPDANGAVYIEAANLSNMCDFNEVIHGIPREYIDNFLDRDYFEKHDYIYFYMDGNILVYYIVAAYSREDTRLLEQYDFSYAYGCQQFIDEMYSGKSMNKNLRSGWERGITPEHFLITLTTEGYGNGNQNIVVGCLVADVAGNIDREVDWSYPDNE